MRMLSAVAGLSLLCASSLLAQNHMGMTGASPAGRGAAPLSHRPPVGISGGQFRNGFNNNRRGFARNGFGLGAWPYWADYSDYGDYQPAQQPAAPAPAPVQQVKQEPVPDPVLLELQGNQWVRVQSFAMVPAQSPPQAQTAANTKDIPPAVLVYRDGHSEELRSYSIIGDAIYAKSNYWTDGSWTRTIQIADLDIPATLKQNQDRGVKFELPSGPGEVMLRP